MAPRIHMMSFVIGLLLSLRGVLALIGLSSGGGDAAVVTAEVFSSGHTLLSFFFSFAMMQILKRKTALAGI